jgi:hypothetical protein
MTRKILARQRIAKMAARARPHHIRIGTAVREK